MRPTARPAQLLLALTLACVALPAAAQHGAPGDPAPTAPREARQFDFLLGQWSLVAEPKVSFLAATFHGQPRLSGTWKAWRAMDGFGIADEMRLTDGDGNPRSLTHSVRFFDRAAGHWTISLVDVYRARVQASTATWRNGAMTTTSRSTDAAGKPVLNRSRFYDITPRSFRWQQDRSYDGGKTWDEGTLKITATRVAPAAPR